MLKVAVLSLSLLVCFFGGFLPMFVPSLTLEIVLRVICGFGVGLIQPLSALLIVDCFKKGSEADALMGVRSHGRFGRHDLLFGDYRHDKHVEVAKFCSRAHDCLHHYDRCFQCIR